MLSFVLNVLFFNIYLLLIFIYRMCCIFIVAHRRWHFVVTTLGVSEVCDFQVIMIPIDGEVVF